MSLISDMMTKALAQTAAAQGVTIEYGGNADGTGTWTSATGVVFARVNSVGTYDDGMGTQAVEQRATLITPNSIAALGAGTYVRVGGSEVWAVDGDGIGDGQRIYELTMHKSAEIRRNRGRFA